MRDEANQTVPRENELDLSLPKSDRVVADDVKERIILGRRERQFQDVADEVRHHRTAAAALWLEMSDVRHRHVVREFEGAVPLLLPIHGSGPKPTALEVPRV